MNRRLSTFIAAATLATVASEATYAGGARIVIRRNAYYVQPVTAGVGSAGIGGPILTNWLLTEADMILRSQLGGNPLPQTTTNAVLPPATTDTSPDPRLLDQIRRLDALMPAAPPQVNGNPGTSPPPSGQPGSPVPPVPTPAGNPEDYPS